jgi:hypothetical protein
VETSFEKMRRSRNSIVWRSLTHRQRATLMSVIGLSAAPFIVGYASFAYQPFIAAGGIGAAAAWIGLLSTYYILARTVLDLLRDILDLIGGTYRTKGGEYAPIDNSRRKTPPYDMLSIPDSERPHSVWEQTAFGVGFLELLMAWIALIGTMYVVFKSPYLMGERPPSAVASRSLSLLFGWAALKISALLVVGSLGSIGYRWDAGITPLIQKVLGVQDTFPGQNLFPRWLNELSIKYLGRPM